MYGVSWMLYSQFGFLVGAQVLADVDNHTEVNRFERGGSRNEDLRVKLLHSFILLTAGGFWLLFNLIPMNKSFDTDRLTHPSPGELVRLRPEMFHTLWARWLPRRRSASCRG